VQRTDRGQDGPAHRAEALDEKRRGAGEDVMLRLEPGNIVLGLLHRVIQRFDPPKPHESVHLVHLPLYRFLHPPQPVDHGVGGDINEFPFAVREAPEQLIKERQPLRILMADHILGQPNERSGHHERSAAGEVSGGEKTGFPPIMPNNPPRRDSLGNKPPCHVPEGIEVVRAFNPDIEHQIKSANCSAGGAKRLWRSARSASCTGR
jgi:hypothetical protein